MSALDGTTKARPSPSSQERPPLSPHLGAEVQPTAICSLCGASVGSAAAVALACHHSGTLHSALTDCGPRCALALAANSSLGLKHWSCCMSTETDALGPCTCSAHRFEVLPCDPIPPAVAASSSANSRPIPQSAAVLSSNPLFGKSDVKRHVVNLDAPPETRWSHIVSEYKDLLPPMLTEISSILGGGVLESLATSFLEVLSSRAVSYVAYSAELRGVAAAAGMSVGQIVALQIGYEAFAACTGIVIDEQGGARGGGASTRATVPPMHLRTMDWHAEELQALTCEVEFVKGGVVIFRATTWAGFVGVLTGVRAGGFSVAVNYRRTKWAHEEQVKLSAKWDERAQKKAKKATGATANFLQVLALTLEGGKTLAYNLAVRGLLGRHWPVSFLVRAVLEDEQDFESALAALVASELMAPCYLTVCGTKAGEGAVVSREREGGLEHNDVRRLGGGGDAQPPWLVQANMDCWRDGLGAYLENKNEAQVEEENEWQDICQSVERRDFVNRALTSCSSAGEGEVSIDDLWLIASTPPCLAGDTIYTAAMIPACGSLVTRLHVTSEMLEEGEEKFGDVARGK